MQEPQSGLRIFRASQEESDQARQIIDEYCDAIGVVVRDTPVDFAKYFADDSGIWLAQIKDEIVGCVILRPLPQIEGACEVKRMYVKPSQRGKQLAAKLMEALHTFAAKSGYSCCYLDSKDDLKAAIRLYEGLGYSHCERYNDNPQATVFMRKLLNY